MATEKDWAHIWLSEGFATYMTLLYMESRYGKDTMAIMLKEDRRQIIAATSSNLKPVIDKSVTDYMELLNTNSYQKGGWILHMLRQELGDVVFWQCMKNYYHDFAGKNADTEDFQQVVEKTSGRSFAPFFKQWLYTPGHPKLNTSWKYDSIQKKVVLQFLQLQDLAFEFDLDFSFRNTQNKIITTGKAHLKEKSTRIEIAIDEIPGELELDPDNKLLFEEITLDSLLKGRLIK
jgi:aminopeptidase N